MVAVHGLCPGVASWGRSWSRCSGCSSSWLLSLWSTGCSSCGTQARQLRLVGSVVAAAASKALLSSCGAWLCVLHCLWDPLGPGIASTFPPLAVQFPSTVPPGKSLYFTVLNCTSVCLWLALHDIYEVFVVAKRAIYLEAFLSMCNQAWDRQSGWWAGIVEEVEIIESIL